VESPAGDFGAYLITIFLYEFCLYGVGYICTWIRFVMALFVSGSKKLFAFSGSNPALLAVIVALISGLGTGILMTMGTVLVFIKFLYRIYWRTFHVVTLGCRGDLSH
jgi:hypothetical protein